MVIVDVNGDNVAEEGFFCYKSKPKSEGYRRKLAWLRERFSEGLRLKILYADRGDGRNRSFAFIEYIPGEYAWRAVQAAGFMVIHCLWTVGQGKGKGYATRLLDICLEDARLSGMHGVAMVTSRGNWLTGSKFFLKQGFTAVAQAPPSFELLVKRFDDAPLPTFSDSWEEKLAQYGEGLTILRSDQCPYIDASVRVLLATAEEQNIPARVIPIETPQQAQEMAPSAYGLFNVVYNGKLLSYHPIGKKDFLKRLAK
jgi:hypothetical protein